jgi:dTDP-4-dehydrorhamnose reductase
VKILITGSTGLLGQALTKHLARSCDVTGLARHVPPVPSAGGHVACDLLDHQRTAEVVQGLRPDVVIHAQALSDVDRCEREPELAEGMNVRSTANLVRALEGTGALLVSVSTDHVFDGTKGSPYDEGDLPNPINVYGKSKWKGEQVALGYARAVVVRPSTLFGPARMNFCDHVASRILAHQAVEAFLDQVTSPTYTEDLAEGIADLMGTIHPRSIVSLPSRVFHMTNAGGCSRLEFAHRIADLLDCSREHIRAVRMVQQQRPAPRPAYSALTTRYVPHLVGRTLRPWGDALQAYLCQRRWLN